MGYGTVMGLYWGLVEGVTRRERGDAKTCFSAGRACLARLLVILTVLCYRTNEHIMSERISHRSLFIAKLHSESTFVHVSNRRVVLGSSVNSFISYHDVHYSVITNVFLSTFGLLAANSFSCTYQ